MPTKADHNAAILSRSDIPTSHLVALALTLPVVDMRNELYGRSHAWYALGHSLIAAIEFIVENPGFARDASARALALAGYGLDNLPVDPA